MIGEPDSGAGFEASIAIAIADRPLREAAYEALRTSPARLLGDLSDFRDAAELVSELGRSLPDILLLGLPGMTLDSMELIRQIRAIPGGPRVIAVSDSADPQKILSAMRAGASEFLYAPFGSQFDEAIQRLSAESARERDGDQSRGLVFGFVSAKGGCGASTLASHVAAYLYANTKKRVLLADFDFHSGISSMLLHANPHYHVANALENMRRMDLTLWKALATPTPSGVDLIPAPTEPMDPVPQLRAFSRLLRFWRSQYSFTVLDLGHGMTPLACGLMDAIDGLVLVATEETAALQLAKRAIRTAVNINCGPNRLKLVLNRMPRRPAFPRQELERMMDHPFLGMVPDDRQALEHASAQGGMVDAASTWGAAVYEITAKLAGLPQEAKKVRKLSFLG